MVTSVTRTIDGCMADMLLEFEWAGDEMRCFMDVLRGYWQRKSIGFYLPMQHWSRNMGSCFAAGLLKSMKPR